MSQNTLPEGKPSKGWKALKFGFIAAILIAVAWGYKPATKLWYLYNPKQQDLPLNAPLLDLASAEGTKILAQSSAKADHGILFSKFQTQQYASYCGVASSVAVMNAISNDSSWTQDNWFTEATKEVREQKKVLFGGMSLGELGGLLQANGAKVEVFHAEDVTEETFRQRVIDNLSRPHDFVLVNYQRKSLKQVGGGHISPLSAYDAQSDMALILDTSTYKYPHTWVPMKDLWTAMNTVDSSSNRSRGYVFVSPGQ